MNKRICSKCGLKKDETFKNFYRVKGKSDKFRSVCKECTSDGKTKKRNLPLDVFSRYDIDKNGCWVYNRRIDELGYGIFYMQQASYKAHRIAYSVINGDIPKGLVIDHICSNRACINPEHLEAVTQKENIRRAWERARNTGVHCNTCQCQKEGD